MKPEQKKEILLKFGAFFREKIAVNHLTNLSKLSELNSFDVNPFLLEYLAIFLNGKSDADSLARALIYPRILGTSITTSFGQNLQNIAPEIFKSVLGSTTSGIDVEFIDQIDGRKKYCQIKSGPNTVNNDDADTIKNHFQSVRNLARTNNAPLNVDDMVVGVLYGKKDDLNSFYRKIEQNYPIFVGKDFWHRLTGDESFYTSLIETFGNAARETKAKDTLEEVIRDLANDIKTNYSKKQNIK